MRSKIVKLAIVSITSTVFAFTQIKNAKEAHAYSAGDYTFSVENNVLTATNEETSEITTLTLSCSDTTYSATQYGAILNLDEFIAATGLDASATIVYSGTSKGVNGDVTYEETIEAPINAGNYTAKANVVIEGENYVLAKNFKINQMGIHYVDFLAVDDGDVRIIPNRLPRYTDAYKFADYVYDGLEHDFYAYSEGLDGDLIKLRVLEGVKNANGKDRYGMDNDFQYGFNNGYIGTNTNRLFAANGSEYLNYVWTATSTSYATYVRILRADYDLSEVVFETEKEYNGEMQFLTIKNLPVGLDGIQLSATLSGGAATYPSDGEQVVTINFSTTSENYNVPDSFQKSFRIIKKKVQVSIGEVGYYDGNLKTPSITFDVNDETKNAIIEIDSNQDCINAGTFNVRFTLPKEDNGEDLEDVYELIAGDGYSVVDGVGYATITIDKRPIEVTISNASSEYGDEIVTPSINVTSTNKILDGDTPWKYSDEYLALDKNTSVSNGSVSILDVNDSNYDITFIDNLYSITPRNITITADDKNSEYGVNVLELTATLSKDLAENDSIEDVFSLTKEGDMSIGEHNIIVNDLNNDNYNITTINGTYTISPKSITIKADDKTSVYGDDLVSLTASITSGSLVYGDILADIIELEKEEGLNAGEYIISIKLKDNDNYNVTTNSATYTITPKEVAISGIKAIDKTYDGTKNVELDLSEALIDYAYILDGDTVNITSAFGSFETKSAGNDKVVNITNISLDNTNYKASSSSLTQISGAIFKKGITISEITAENKEYDGTTNATLKLDNTVIEGLIDGDVVEISATGTFENKNAADNKIVNISSYVINGLDGENYFASSESISETKANISKKAVVVSNVTNNTNYFIKNYDGTTNLPLYILSADNAILDGKTDGDSLSVELTKATLNDKYPGVDKVATIEYKLVGEDKDNYYLAEEGKQECVTGLTVNKRPLNVVVTKTPNKVYNGTVYYTFNWDEISYYYRYTQYSVLSEDDVKVNFTIKLFDTEKNVGNRKYLRFYSAELSGEDKDYYNLDLSSMTYSTGFSFSILPAELTVLGITAKDKNYDGTTFAQLVTKNAELIGILGDDDVVLDKSQTFGTFSDANAGENKQVVISNISLSGNEAVNYVIAPCYANATINKKQVKVTGITANSKDYDGTTDATLDLTNVALSGVVDGDTLTVTATGSFSNENAGENKEVVITNIILNGENVSNYTLSSNSQTTAVANINKIDMNITSSGFSGTYDKEAHGINISNIQANSSLTYSTDGINYSSAEITYTNAGTYKVYFKIENENYNTVSGSVDIVINKKEITISGIKAFDKVYDGNTNIELDFSEVVFDGIIDGDNLEITADASFDNPNYGSNKTVSITNLVLGGTSINNYCLAESGNQETTTASITKNLMNIEVTGYEGTYDKESHSITITGAPENATIKYSIDNENYSTYELEFTNAGTYTIYYLVECDNYEIVSGNAQIIINKKEVAISGIKANSKDYDGNTDVEFSYEDVEFSGIIDGDILTITATGSFSDPNAGIDKVVTISNLELSGDSVNNYILNTTDSQNETVASINKIDMNITSSGFSGTYDKEAHGITISNVPTNSTITYSLDGTNYSSEEITYKNAGTYTLYFRIENMNYNTFEGNENIIISKSEVKISGIKALDKVYDGSTNVTLDYSEVSFNGLIEGDSLTITGEGSFDNPNYGSNKTVSITNLVLGGTSINNYCLAESGNQETTTASITKDQMNIEVTGYTGTYDKNSHKITITNTPKNSTIKYSLDNENYSTNELEFTNAGTYAVYYIVECENYETVSGNTQVIINKKEVIVSNIKANDKVYDGTTNVTLDYSEVVINGIIDGDIITINAQGSFENKNVGNNILVIITNITLGENDNYVLALSENQESTTANISKKEITISGIKANDKTYDGTTNVTLDYSEVSFNGLIEGDSLTITGEGSFDNPNYGSNKTVSITNLVLGGTSIDNYELASTGNQETTTASITKDKMNIEVTGYEGTYDKNSHKITITNTPENSTIKYSLDNENFDTNELEFTNAGTYTVYYIIDCENYETVSGNTQVIINKKAVTVSGIKANNKAYDRTMNATLDFSEAVFDGIISGDSLEIVATGLFNNYNAFENVAVFINSYILSGIDSNNYELAIMGNQTTTFATIFPKAITISGIKAKDKIYDGSTSATLDYSEVSFNGLIEGDSLTITGEGSFDNPNYGSNKTVSITNLVLGGTSINNYYLAESGNQETTTANITKAQMNVEVIGYEGTYDKDSHSIIITGAPENATIKYSLDNENFSTDELSFTNTETYVVYYIIECENYETVSGNTQVIINKKEVTVSNIKATDKTYDGTLDATLDYSEVVIDGVIDGDSININANGEFEIKNVGIELVVTISNITIDNPNYLLLTEVLEATANITKKSLAISGIKANDKIIDGNTNVVLDYSSVIIDGVIDGDNLNIQAEAKFNNSLVGNNKIVTISNIELLGDDIDNYEIDIELSQKETKASIIKEETIDPVDPVDPTDPTDPENNDPVNPEDDKPKEKKNNVGLVVGLIVGIIALASAIGAVSIILIKKH